MAEKKNTSYPKEKINILFLENISDAAIAQFVGAGYANVKKLTGALSEEELIKDNNLSIERPFIRSLFKDSPYFDYQIYRREELTFTNKRTGEIYEYLDAEF